MRRHGNLCCKDGVLLSSKTHLDNIVKGAYKGVVAVSFTGKFVFYMYSGDIYFKFISASTKLNNRGSSDVVNILQRMNVEYDVRVTDSFRFSSRFPDFYYKSEESAAANPGIMLCSNLSHFPYYEMVVGGSEWLADSEIRYFLMIDGKSGKMDVWEITFDMSKEEVEAKFREMEQRRG